MNINDLYPRNFIDVLQYMESLVFMTFIWQSWHRKWKTVSSFPVSLQLRMTVSLWQFYIYQYLRVEWQLFSNQIYSEQIPILPVHFRSGLYAQGYTLEKFQTVALADSVLPYIVSRVGSWKSKILGTKVPQILKSFSDHF